MQRKPVSKVIGIESIRPMAPNPDPPPEVPVSKRKPNQYVNRSIVSMFLFGKGVRRVSRFHRAEESDVEEALRNEMIYGGSLQRMRRAA